MVVLMPDTRLPPRTIIPAAMMTPKFQCTMDPVTRTLIMTYESNSDLTTFYGGQSDTAVELSEQQVSHMPHDMVHLAISRVPEGAVDMGVGVTPDIPVKLNDGTYEVIEVTTVATISVAARRRAIDRKIASYSHLFGTVISKFEVVVVSPTAVETIDGMMDPILAAPLITAYLRGLSIKKKWEMAMGWRSEEMSQNQKDLYASLSRIPEHILPPLPEKKKIKIDLKATYKKDHDDFVEFTHSRSNPEWRQEVSAIIHVPMMFSLTNGEEMEVCEKESSVYHKIYNELCMLPEEDERTMEDLEDESYCNAGSLKKTKFDSGWDIIKIETTRSDRIDLALKGVVAKNVSSKTLDANRARSQIPMSFSLNTESVDRYMDNPWTTNDKPAFNKEVLEIHDSTKNPHYGTGLPSLLDNWIEETSCFDIEMIRNFEVVMREVALNATRNLRPAGKTTEFIARKIHGVDAFVVIRTSNYDKSSNLFYSVFFSGENYSDGMFESSHPIHGSTWRFFPFLSTDRNRMSHYQGLTSTVMTISAEIYQQQISPVGPSGIKLSEIAKPVRSAIMILLSASTELSQSLQQFRFYYMELLSGLDDSRQASSKCTNKYPDVIHNPLTVYFLRRLFIIHQNLGDLEQMIETAVTGEEEREQSFQRSVPVIDTPFHTTIKTAQDLVNSMYYCNLHHPDISEAGHGSIRIIEKTAKREMDFQDRKLEPGFRTIGDSGDAKDYGLFQADGPSIRAGSELLKEKIMKTHVIPDNGWDHFITKTIALFMLKSKIDDLATTKVSTIAFEDDQYIEGDDLSGIGCRKKCLEVIMERIEDGTYAHSRTSCNIGQVYYELVENESSCLKVTLFRKSQIGGVREIFVLTMHGRIYLKAVNDVYRSLAEMCYEEKLTGEATKDNFVAEHYRNRMKTQRHGKYKYAATAKVSSDMTNWAQLFTLDEFAVMSRCLIPEKFHSLLAFGFQMGKDKQLQLPRALLKQWLKGDFCDSDKAAKKLEKEFRGLSEPRLMDAFRSWFSNESNMMQGIYHFVSTVYHLIHQEVLKKVIEEAFDEVEVVVDYEVSSDDEGLLISFLSSDESVIRKACKQLTKTWDAIKASVDQLFGIRTSFEKSTFSWSDLFEFNSKFYIRNTVANPTIKFLARACDDNPSESLSKRVAQYLSQLRQIREAGCTGYVVHWASIGQVASFCDNLGCFTMSWFDIDRYKKTVGTGLTFLGHLPICSPTVAGLVDSKYYNYLACTRDSSLLKLCLFFGNEGLPNTNRTMGAPTLSFSIFKDYKWKSMLKRLGIDRDVELEMDSNLLRIYLTGPTTAEESLLVLRNRVCDRSIARSLAVLTRSDTVRQSAYLLYAAIYYHHDEEEKLTLRMVMDRITKDTAEVGMEVVFPMRRFLENMTTIESADYVINPRSHEPRMTFKYLSPYYMSPDHHKFLKNMLASRWYGIRPKLSRTAENELCKLIEEEIPFISLDRSLGEDNIENMINDPLCPLNDRSSIAAFVESYVSRAKSMKILTRGSTAKGYIGVESLLKHNTMQKAEVGSFIVAEDPDLPRSTMYESSQEMRLISRFEDRCKAWQELVHTKVGFDLVPYMRYDLLVAFRYVPDIAYRGERAKNKKFNAVHKFYALCSDKLSLTEYMRLTPGVPVFYGDVVIKNNAPKGNYEALVYDAGVFTRGVWDKKRSIWILTSSDINSAQPSCFNGKFEKRKSNVSLRPPDVKFSDLMFCGEEICCVMKTDDKLMKKKVHIKMIFAQAQNESSDDISDILPKVLNDWLCRSAIPFDYPLDVAFSLSSNEWLERTAAKAIVQNASRFRKTKEFRQMAERQVSVSEDESSDEDDDDYGNDYNLLVEDLGEAFKDLVDDPIDFDFSMVEVNDMGADMFALAAGLESFANEGLNMTMEYNKPLREIVRWVCASDHVSEERLSRAYKPELQKFISYFRSCSDK